LSSVEYYLFGFYSGRIQISMFQAFGEERKKKKEEVMDSRPLYLSNLGPS